MDNPKTFIFIGRSGCGKGTQAELLIKHLEEKGEISSDNPLFYLESGNRFRDFIKGTSHSSRLAKEIMDRGERQPDFLAVWNWSHLLVENIMGDEHIIFDGTPRSLLEAQALDTALKFYKREKPQVFFMNVSRDWSRTRLLERGRFDDKDQSEVEKRLDWFEKDVMPAVEYYRIHPDYKFTDINGEQTIEEVHAEILKSL